MQMPEPDQEIMNQQARIAVDLTKLLGKDGVVADQNAMSVFESDGLNGYRQTPMVVALPANAHDVSAVLSYCHKEGIKVVPRGAGTSLSGGALPLADAVLLGLSRMNQILDIDYENRAVVTQPGVTNLAITHAVEGQGYYYAPDPSSQIACSIGGNVAENSGGVHCLKYGLTTNNLLGIEMVTMEGEIIRLGGKHLDAEGYDLLGVM
ncbi:MAG: FAD-binding protein, partial [Alphaproteobacteria bacterium]|nr:FAD-binding protein [Alphaproteobacteria bacterium]